MKPCKYPDKGNCFLSQIVVPVPLVLTCRNCTIFNENYHTPESRQYGMPGPGASAVDEMSGYIYMAAKARCMPLSCASLELGADWTHWDYHLHFVIIIWCMRIIKSGVYCFSRRLGPKLSLHSTLCIVLVLDPQELAAPHHQCSVHSRFHHELWIAIAMANLQNPCTAPITYMQ